MRTDGSEEGENHSIVPTAVAWAEPYRSDRVKRNTQLDVRYQSRADYAEPDELRRGQTDHPPLPLFPERRILEAH